MSYALEVRTCSEMRVSSARVKCTKSTTESTWKSSTTVTACSITRPNRCRLPPVRNATRRWYKLIRRSSCNAIRWSSPAFAVTYSP